MARKTKAERRKARRRLAGALLVLTVGALALLLLLPEREDPGPAGPPAGPTADEAEAVARDGPTEAPAPSGSRSTQPEQTAPESVEDRASRDETRPPSAGRPRVAIVIDDVGHSMAPVEDLLDIGLPLTYAVIPHLSHSRQASRKLASRGQEVILHQPMEPLEYPGVPLEEGGILVGMVDSEVERLLQENLASVPEARGVNNHKGSRATQDRALMETFIAAAGRRGLYFLDSRTSAGTVAEQVARELRVPTIRRHVFLDNEADVDSIHRQLRELLDVARREGVAVGIGHARPSMVWALETARPWLEEAQVELVPLSELVH